MRTTLTLDDDVAALLARARQAHHGSLKELVNKALRQGLQELNAPKPRRRPYRTRSARVGRCLLGGLDDVAEALALAEGDAFK